MKKILLLLLAMPLLMACKPEEPVRKMVGEYTYYISGNVRWWGEGHDGENSALEPESGKLLITAEKEGTYLATFYTESGDFFICRADADENEIYLSQGRRNLKVDSIDCSVLVSSDNCYITTTGFKGYLVYKGNPVGDFSQSITSDYVAITALRK